MSSRPNTEAVKDAFMATATALDSLSYVKERLIKLHYALEEVSNSAFLVENHHRWASPDSDTHDVLFARHEKAKEDLANTCGGAELNILRSQIDEAEVLLHKAKLLL